jgi:conjugative relaxase-like TrwC/TraI family protein
MTSQASAVSAYFAKGDYYAKDSGEIPGVWGGDCADRLQLQGEVKKSTFELLCKNLDPNTGEPLTPRTNDQRRCGYDFSFSVPKSVTVLFGLTEDKSILEAFQQSVNETMKELEQLAETRVRVDGQHFERKTGNLLWASFTHTTARPVDGHPDPQLHQHVFVLKTMVRSIATTVFQPLLIASPLRTVCECKHRRIS